MIDIVSDMYKCSKLIRIVTILIAGSNMLVMKTTIVGDHW